MAAVGFKALLAKLLTGVARKGKSLPTENGSKPAPPLPKRWTSDEVSAMHASLDKANQKAEEESLQREKEFQSNPYRKNASQRLNGVYAGPRGGKYRIVDGKKRYDVP